MRFNDLLRTVIANIGDGTGAAVTRWRQCMDLLAQYDVAGAGGASGITDEERAAVLERIAQMRPAISLEQRIASVVELGPRLRSPGLVRLLSQDHPSVVVAMMTHVRLADADWASIMSDLGPLARSVLRRRNDLGSQARAALDGFGSTDLALPSHVTPEPVALAPITPAPVTPDARREVAAPLDEPDDAPSQFEAIVARIERYTEARAHRDDAVANAVVDAPAEQGAAIEGRADWEAVAQPVINRFAFETDVSGLIRLAAGAPRAAAFGLSIAMPALDSRHGADGTALGAFRRRAAFEDARFMIGAGPLEGEWRISAEPRFDRASGRFVGYVGSGRREYPCEGLVRASGAEASPGWAGLSAAGTRQLIHELRTPLNAIQGYAEMIEAQMLGPVPDLYRDMARRILADARSLVTTFDDLDLASRLERGDALAGVGPVDIEQTIRAVAAAFAREGHEGVDIRIDRPLTGIRGDQGQIERMLGHLLRAGCAALAADERLDIALDTDRTGGNVRIVMRHPLALQGLGETDLMDHGYLVDQKLFDAPILGLAFTLRLVRGIARHLGGGLAITEDALMVSLPAMPVMSGEQERQR
jgi:signal transduction histidine kinase